MKENTNKTKVVEELGTIGMILAAVISWSLNHSFWWMLLHAVLGWFYVLYWAIMYT